MVKQLRFATRMCLLVVVLMIVALGRAGPARADGGTFEAIRQADALVARIGFRLATANAPLCDRLEPGFGIALHTPSQYSRELRDEAGRHFRFDGPVAVEAVVPGSPAEVAGIRTDDTLLSVGSIRFAPADPGAQTSTAALIAASAQLADLPPDAAVDVTGRRAGQPFTARIQPLPACRSRFEVAIGPGFEAQADGEMVQIGGRFLETYPEEQIAAVLAHEFAHNILRHRERLETVGVSFGILAGFGRNVRYFRQTELEADILSVALLANAAYDPTAALQFWRDFGRKRASGILRSRSHPSWRDRVATIEAAIGQLGTGRPARPAVLASRDRPLDGNWQALIAEGGLLP